MNRIRIKFIRGEEVKFVSHLDIMRTFARAAKRARLPLSYSQGFNPHPQIVFGLPLSVGVTSEAEYADLGIDGEVEPGELMELLGRELPKGFDIVDAVAVGERDNIMKSIVAASYDVLFLCKESYNNINNAVQSLMNMREITVKKFSKKGYKETNIRPLIYSLKLEEQYNGENKQYSNLWLGKYVEENIEDFLINNDFKREDLYCLSMLVSAGNISNLNPALVMTALNEQTGLSIKQVKIHRTGLFTGRPDKLSDPLSEAVLKTMG